MSSSTSLGPLAALTGPRHGVTTRRQAYEAGLGKNAILRLITRGVLEEPVAGVLVVAGSSRTWEQRLVVGTLACKEHGLAIGPSSTRLHRVDGFEKDEALLIALPKGRALRLEGVAVSQTLHTYPKSDRFEIDGIACSGLARAICDIAPLGPKVLERSIDDFQRRGYSLEWLRRTAEPLRVRGRPAIAFVLAEIERRTVDPALRGSWFEQLVEECLRSPRLPGLRRQFEVRDQHGAFIARADLAGQLSVSPSKRRAGSSTAGQPANSATRPANTKQLRKGGSSSTSDGGRSRRPRRQFVHTSSAWSSAGLVTSALTCGRTEMLSARQSGRAHSGS